MPEYGDGSFPGGVLDKGTLDALLCGDSDEEESLQMLLECYRVGWVLGRTGRGRWVWG